MPIYDIRLLKPSDRAAVTYRTLQLSDSVAIQKALEAAGDGDRVEVWRGMKCVYAGKVDQPSNSWTPFALAASVAGH